MLLRCQIQWMRAHGQKRHASATRLVQSTKESRSQCNYTEALFEIMITGS